MTDSNEHEALAAKQERNRNRRIEGIKRWVQYIQDKPPGIWGPQQNTLINEQLEAAQSTDLSASHHQRVRSVASDIVAKRTKRTADSDSENPE